MRCFTELDTERALRDFKNCVDAWYNYKGCFGCRKVKILRLCVGGTDRGIW